MYHFNRKVFILWLCLLSPLSVAAESAPYFLALSDIHFSPFADCPSDSDDCPWINKLQAQPYTDWQALFEQYSSPEPSEYRSDTNYALLQSTLKHLKRHQQQAAFVLMPGDFLAHNFIQKYQTYTGDKALQHYRSFIDKTFMFLSSQLKQTFPAIPVYSAIGNNDSYHGNYYTDPNGAFYHFLTGEHSWGQLFVDLKNRAQFAAVFPQAGYYEVVPPQANDNRIIVLNTVMFSANAVGVNLQSAVDAQFNWLAKRLETAQTKGYHVWLVYHIPNGADAYHNVNKAADSQAVMFWQSTYNLRFLKLIRQYAAVISGLITGHTHMDGLQYANKKPIIFNTFVTSISPIYGNNPSYKRYYYRNSNLALEDFIVYYFNLAEKPRQWRKEYRFNHVYQPHCTDCLLAEGALHIAYQGKLAEDYQHYYAISTDSQPITQGGWWYYWCAINYVTQENYQRCRAEGVE